jgi:predicted N-acyltransferase
MELHLLQRIEDVDAAAWDRLNPRGYPFLAHGFLAALERHGAVAPETGWHPHHLALFDGATLVAAAPAYLKTHSWGEFVFDFAWAEAYARNGLDYYPKLVAAVPFTPATGPRLLLDPARDPEPLADALARGAQAVVDRAGLSSAHWLFPHPADAEYLRAAGYSIRHGCQYHWYNRGYADFEAFLGALSAKKRKNIRRERRQVSEQGIGFRWIPGTQARDHDWLTMYQFYQDTFDRHGNPSFLEADFFPGLGNSLGDAVLLVLAYQGDNEEPVAGALFLKGADTLFGRYWGTRRDIPGLHFETCYYQGIDFCIEHGLASFEPGAQGEHKLLRGFSPVTTRSCHWVRDPVFREAVGRALATERHQVSLYREAARAHEAFRQTDGAGEP